MTPEEKAWEIAEDAFPIFKQLSLGETTIRSMKQNRLQEQITQLITEACAKQRQICWERYKSGIVSCDGSELCGCEGVCKETIVKAPMPEL